MNHKEITDHSLHLLVDNQLDAESAKKLKKEIATSPELQKKLKNIKEVKELIALAYIQEQPRISSRKHKNGPVKGSFYVALAASFIMSIGLTLGWFAHQQFESEVYVVAQTESHLKKMQPEVPLEINLHGARKYMLHFDSLNEEKLKTALLETSSILDSYAISGLPIKVDLLFDQQSVTMFKPQHAAQLNYLKSVIKGYQNIQLFACSESLQLFMSDGELNGDINLFHTNKVVKEMIPQRMDNGWVYIKA